MVDAIETGSAEYKGTQFIFLPFDLHQESAVRFTALGFSKRTMAWPRTGHLFRHIPLSLDPPGVFAIPDTDRAAVLVEGHIFCVEVEFRSVVQDRHRDGAQFAFSA